jgi:hypothetical protein
VQSFGQNTPPAWKTESFALLLVMTGFEDKVQSFPFLVRWCVLINMPQNFNGTWQRHNRVVYFRKRQKITVSCGKFFQKNMSDWGSDTGMFLFWIHPWVVGGSELRSKSPILKQLNYMLILNTIISYNLWLKFQFNFATCSVKLAYN